MGRSKLAAVLVVLGYFVALELMLVAAVLFFPDFEEHMATLRAMAPIPVLQQMFDELEAGGVEAYVAGQHFFKGCNTLGTAAAVLFAVGAVAGEAHRGTLEIWLARPYSRARILSERWLAGAAAVVLPVFATSATVPWLAGRIGEHIELAPMMLGSAHQGALLLAIFSLAFLASTLGDQPTRIAVGLLFLTTVMFGVYMIEHVTHWSLYRLADIEDFVRIFRTGALDLGVVGPLLAAAAALYAFSLAAFRRRVP